MLTYTFTVKYKGKLCSLLLNFLNLQCTYMPPHWRKKPQWFKHNIASFFTFTMYEQCSTVWMERPTQEIFTQNTCQTC